MITLISALNLTAKIGISIAVFVVLIAVEVLALVMLVKWKKNYKQALIKKAKEEKRDAELANSTPVTAIDLPQEHAEVTPVENTAEDASEEKQDENVQEEAPTEEKSQEVVSEQKSENEEVTSEEKQESVDDTKNLFAFAPFMMLAATSTTMTLRGLLYTLVAIAVGLAIAIFATAVRGV